MKQFKPYVIIILLAVLVIPSLVYAAWWNPLSWDVWYALFRPQNTQNQNKEITSKQNNLNNQGNNLTTNTKQLFGTMLAFNVNDAAIGIQGLQKGWTEFKKDNSAYQNLKSNLNKIIQDRAKLVEVTDFSPDREIVPYFTWNVIEPRKGQFDWELSDLYVQAASRAGVKISAVIQPFASWDQKNMSAVAGCNALDFAYYDYKAGPPNDLTEYENFLAKTAERYKGKVSVWEIGNEVEGNCGGYKNNPQKYIILLKTSYETIKKADPQAIVVNGGALEFGEVRNFWQRFFALGGGQYIDYFNLHYNMARSPDAKLDAATFQEDLMFFNNLMDKNDGKKPLYLTEFGIYSGSPSAQPLGRSVKELIQAQVNLLIEPTPAGGSCGDNVCDNFEKQNPNACPQDCGGNIPSRNSLPSPGQPSQGSAPIQNIQPNQQGQALHNLSENEQAVLYFKDSILAFASGAKVIFVDLIGSDNNVVGSSMAFNTDGQARLFLTTLKTIDGKIRGFSKVEKIADGQYKFTIDRKIVYALWAGALPNEISGKVKATDIKGKEQFMDTAGIKLKTDQPVFVEF